MPPPYVYPATVVSVHDGDTFTADIVLPIRSTHSDFDLGFFLRVQAHQILLRVPLRLAACNARELAEVGGAEAASNLAKLLPVGSTLTVRSHKPLVQIDPDKYAPRWDADVTLPGGADLVPTLIAEQWLAAWDGVGARPVPPWPRTVTP